MIKSGIKKKETYKVKLKNFANIINSKVFILDLKIKCIQNEKY